jgi:hypothetical protein
MKKENLVISKLVNLGRNFMGKPEYIHPMNGRRGSSKQ